MPTNKQQRIERMIDGADQLTKVTAPDFFYTRLRAKLDNSASVPAGDLLLRPVLMVAALSLLLVINAFLIGGDSTANSSTAIDDRSAGNEPEEALHALAMDDRSAGHFSVFEFSPDPVQP